jgi:hypothetical protein
MQSGVDKSPRSVDNPKIDPGGTRRAEQDSIESMALARIFHERFCCYRGFAAATRLRQTSSPLAPSTYGWGLAPFFLVPVPV